MTAWVDPNGSSSGNQGNYLIQEITGLKPGLYRVNCQGFYFNPSDKDDKDNTSFVFASQNIDNISNQTALKTIELNDWYMMQDGTYNGSEQTTDGKNGFTGYSINIVSMPVKYSQRAILMKTRMWTIVDTTAVWQSS